MQSPLRVAYRNLESTPSLEQRLQEEAAKLERVQHKGGLFAVKLNIAVPGGDVVVTHDGPKDPAHEDVYVAIRDAFAAAPTPG